MGMERQLLSNNWRKKSGFHAVFSATMWICQNTVANLTRTQCTRITLVPCGGRCEPQFPRANNAGDLLARFRIGRAWVLLHKPIARVAAKQLRRNYAHHMIHSIMYVRVALPSQSSKSINTVVYFLSYKIIVYVSIVGKKRHTGSEQLSSQPATSCFSKSPLDQPPQIFSKTSMSMIHRC